MLNPEAVKKKSKCCACGGSLADSKRLNLVALTKEADWPWPVWGNYLLGLMGLAVAVFCDKCIKEKKEAKFAVEWNAKTGAITYHPVEELEDVPKDLFKPLDILEPGRHKIAW